MESTNFKILEAVDEKEITWIAQAYHAEWNIPFQNTFDKLIVVANSPEQFQVVMYLNNIPVATGGVYSSVGLTEKLPEYRIHKHWLALVYTEPQFRRRGLGRKLCKFIEQHAFSLGFPELYLFTNTAQSLYSQLGWTLSESLSLNGKNLDIMKRTLM